MSGAPGSDDEPGLTPDNRVGLLGVFAAQFGSYTTLLWQVPALSLTAQSFLLTIALGPGSSKAGRLITSVLSFVVAVAAMLLMHDQRGHAINHGEFARKLSEQLRLDRNIGSLEVDDAVPKKTDAQEVWKAVNHWIYGVWMVCMLLFAITDLLVITSALAGLSWFR